MYAPTFPGWHRHQVWHKVNPVDLVRPICHSHAVVNCSVVRDELPDDADYCPKCHRQGYPDPRAVGQGAKHAD